MDARRRQGNDDMSGDWNCSQGALLGAALGAAYALWICALANLLSLPLIGVISLALVLGAVSGAALLAGVAGILNFAKAAIRRKADRSATIAVGPACVHPA